jgi:signal transduction histidine kinase
VRLDIDGAHRRVVVTDDGRDGGAGPDGQGLIGMRERVAVYGGTLDIGRRPDGGYRVVATRPPA